MNRRSFLTRLAAVPLGVVATKAVADQVVKPINGIQPPANTHISVSPYRISYMQDSTR